jgi:hypothetical protein
VEAQKAQPNHFSGGGLSLISGRKKSTSAPSIFAKVCFSYPNSKTRQNTSLNFLNRSSYLPGPVISGFKDGFIFFFFIYFG